VDLRKADADPAWPKIVAQATFAGVRPQACDTVLAAMAAALACAQALALIDRPVPVSAGPVSAGPVPAGPVPAGPVSAGPATVNGTLEVVLPDWQWRRRTWPPHPLCPCGAAYRDGSARTAPCRNDAVTDAS
jgi:hypothetical protein